MNLTTEKEQLSVFGLSYLLKTVLACIILFPAYSRLSNNSYYIGLVLPNIVIVFLLGWYLLFCRKFDSCIIEKTLTGLIKPIFFCQILFVIL